MATFGDLKFGDSRFFTTPPPPHSPQIDPAPNRNYLGHYNYEVLHEVLSMKICSHH